MSNQRITHEEVCEAVITHFKERGFTVDTECDIQFGTRYGRADVVVKTTQGHWLAIVECKQGNTGIPVDGEKQLKSYLSATDTRLGVLAFSEKPNEWTYYENQRCNTIVKIDQGHFNRYIGEQPTADRKTQNIIRQIKRKLRHRTIALWLAMAIIVAIPIGVCIFQLTQKEMSYQVRRIVDGDTIEIDYDGQPTSVQLIGVNAPETVHPDKPSEPYGEEASNFLRDLLLRESVYLRFEDNERDQYGRLIGYVYRSSDDLFVNLEVIREGFGRVDPRHLPLKHEELFRTYQCRAREVQRGLWKSSY